jgi:hypothetical protein
MRMARRRQLGLFLVMSVALAQTGCLLALAGAGVAAGAYAYSKGNLTTVLTGDFANSWHAVCEALGDLGMPIVDMRRRDLGGTIEARTAARDRVVVHLQAISAVHSNQAFLTEIKVRVGVLGHREISERIIDQVRFRLAARISPPRPGTQVQPAPAAGPYLPPTVVPNAEAMSPPP